MRPGDVGRRGQPHGSGHAPKVAVDHVLWTAVHGIKAVLSGRLDDLRTLVEIHLLK
jgi:hypothetical protein